MNLSEASRKAQVLAYLINHDGEWVNGTELANQIVGGSEGLKRLRELRAEGHRIEQRRHPNPAIDQWQYRYVRPEQFIAPSRTEPVNLQPTPVPGYRFEHLPHRVEFGAVLLCPRCKGYRRKARTDRQGIHHEAEALCMDPENRQAPCVRCNGLGLVPNIGPVTATYPPESGAP